VNWEKLFRDYLTAVYGGDHIEARKAIDELEDPEQKKVAEALWRELWRADGNELPEEAE
jgi:predicted nucleotidyltransferase